MVYKLKNANKRMYDVTLEKVQNITKQYLQSESSKLHPLVRDTGRMILAFKTASYEDEMTTLLLGKGYASEFWYKMKEKQFNFTDENGEHNIIVVEYKTEERVEIEIYGDAEQVYNEYHGIKEDGGRYSIHDVYTPSELGVKISY